MTVQEVIDKAVEGGYHIYGSDGMDTLYDGANSEYSVWTRRWAKPFIARARHRRQAPVRT